MLYLSLKGPPHIFLYSLEKPLETGMWDLTEHTFGGVCRDFFFLHFRSRIRPLNPLEPLRVCN
jgi:hypothetical protein